MKPVPDLHSSAFGVESLRARTDDDLRQFATAIAHQAKTESIACC